MTFRISDRAGWAGTILILGGGALAILQAEWRVLTRTLDWINAHEGLAAWVQAVLSAGAIMAAVWLQDRERRAAIRQVGEQEAEALLTLATRCVLLLHDAQGLTARSEWSEIQFDYHEARVNSELATLESINPGLLPGRTCTLAFFAIKDLLFVHKTVAIPALKRGVEKQVPPPEDLFDEQIAAAQQAFDDIMPFVQAIR